MKSLNEEINDILTASTGKANKKSALAKLGLTNEEVNRLIATVEVGSTRASFTFGVEMECFVNRGAISTAAARTGMPYEYQGYNHNDGHAYFKFVSDSSVRGMADPIECVSPVLKGADGKKMLKNACKTLNDAGANVNQTCGLHVHIGAAKLTAKQYINVFVNYALLENVISTFMAPSRRNNEYARPISNNAGQLARCRSIEDVRYLLGTRYRTINAESYLRHKTIEFRQHGGTTNFDKIFNWVTFVGKLVIWSKTHRLTERVASIDEIPFLTAKEKEFFKGRAAQFNR